MPDSAGLPRDLELAAIGMSFSGVRFGVLVACIFAVVGLWPASSAINTNTWISSRGGRWQDESAWSLGLLPNRAQSVSITNSNPKYIEIDAETARGFPSALSLADLVVSNTNTLWLNGVSFVPLQIDSETNIWSGLEVSRGGRFVSTESVVLIAGLLRIQAGEFVQDGGLVQASGTTYLHGNGTYHLTNGIFEGEWVDLPYGGFFNQYGGRARIRSLRLIGSVYQLKDGLLESTHVQVSDSGGIAQDGGTNRTLDLNVTGNSSEAGYVLRGGYLTASNVFIGAGLGGSRFEQSGGWLAATNQLLLRGSARYYPPRPISARYTLGVNGNIYASSVLLNQDFGFCFLETSGTIRIAEAFEVSGSPDYQGGLTIRDGTVACANFQVDGPVLHIDQSGGALMVTNLFRFKGWYPGVYGGHGARFALYNFIGGTFSAHDIELAAEWVIGGSGNSRRIVNPGYFKMAGILRIGEADEQLGRFILSSNALIDLGVRGKISFAKSSGETWVGAGVLVVTNWTGSSGKQLLKFGADSAGLTAAQLRQIRFLNPGGFAPGEYSAEILNTGEVVPSAKPALFVGTMNNLVVVLSWSGGLLLQSSTNVAGPYGNVAGATSPYTNELSLSPTRFFRLQP